jgi:class 3 adenylate cyclase
VAPETRYARNGAVHIAYQAFGEGAMDLLYVPQSFSASEHMWDHPAVARFFGRLASFARVITFDRRESGMSDRLGRPPTLEEQMDDVVAVLDAIGSERAGVFAMMEGGPLAMLFAATHPQRVQGLVLYATFARTTPAEGYDWPPPVAERRARAAHVTANWGDGSFLEAFGPSRADDRSLRDWMGRLQRLAMSPATALAVQEVNERLDVRSILPSIRVPTLVLHRREDQGMDVRHARYIAGAIPGARLALLDGSDTLPFLGDSEAIAGEMEEFLTGARSTARDRVLATVLLSDICGSTELAARLGDRRWSDLLAGHHEDAARVIATYQGRPVKSTGDGLLATFDGPARALRAAQALVDAAGQRDLELRVGLHTGEVEVMGDDLGGLAIHIAARVLDHAAPGEVLASGTVKDLVVGSGTGFVDRGVHRLRGVPDEWRLWAVRR